MTPQPPNRRLALRRKPKGGTRAACYPNALGLGRSIALAVLDLSEAGVRLVVREALPPGKEVEVGLEGPGQRRPVQRPGRVVWSVALADGSYCVGIQFDRALIYADLLQLARL
jgi:hypothetical protein